MALHRRTLSICCVVFLLASIVPCGDVPCFDLPFQVSKRDGRIKWSEVTHLEKGGVFTHGSIAELRRLKGEI